MSELMHEDDQDKAKPDNRDKLKAGKNEGSDRSRPMGSDRNATPMSEGKIAVVSHCGIEPYFGDVRKVYQFRVLEFGVK